MKYQLFVTYNLLFLLIHQQEKASCSVSSPNPDDKYHEYYFDAIDDFLNQHTFFNDLNNNYNGTYIDDDSSGHDNMNLNRPKSKNEFYMYDPTTTKSKCGLYLAPSSIPHSGYGMFAGRYFKQNEVIEMSDTMPIIDYDTQGVDFGGNRGILEDYFWYPWGRVQYEAAGIELMGGNAQSFANYHPFHVNTRQGYYPEPLLLDMLLDRSEDPGAGAFNPYQTRILATKEIGVGEEIFANYGSKWGRFREEIYNIKFPDEDDHERGEEIIECLMEVFEGHIQIDNQIYIESQQIMNGGEISFYKFLRREILSFAFDYEGTLELIPPDINWISNNDEFEKSYFGMLTIHCCLPFGFNVVDDICETNVKNGISLNPSTCHGPQPSENVLEASAVYNYQEGKQLYELLVELNDRIAQETDREIFYDKLVEATTDFTAFMDERVASMIPTTRSEAEYLHRNGITSLFLKGRVQSEGWLENEGVCLDNIRVAPSTIKQAGRGAFAVRKIPKGSVIVPAPMLHINQKSFLEMRKWVYDGENEGEKNVFNDDGRSSLVIGHNLFANYCFEHSMSTTLLCMFSNSGWINHKKNCGDEIKEDESCGANADYIWSDFDNTQENLKLSLDEVKGIKYRLFSMDIIATRDILPGEEIFMDYGVKWEQAWKQYVEDWEKPEKEYPTEYVPVNEFTKEVNGLFKTVEELELDPYPENIDTICLYWEDNEEADESDIEWDHVQENPELIEDYISENSVDGSYLSFTKLYSQYRKEGFHPCKVISRDDDENTYTVRIYLLEDEQANPYWDAQDRPMFIENFPGTSIMFINKPYTGDIHLPGSFRHTIQIKEGMYPEHWLDLKVNEII